MQTSADPPTPAHDDLADLTLPNLSERLARYLGARELAAKGVIPASFVERKLDQLLVACRAADTILKVLGVPEIERQRRRLQPGTN